MILIDKISPVMACHILKNKIESAFITCEMGHDDEQADISQIEGCADVTNKILEHRYSAIYGEN